MADRSSILSFRGQMALPVAAGGGDRDRTFAGFYQRAAERVEQPLLQCAAGEELGRGCQGNRDLFPFGHILQRAVGLPALSQSRAADPLADLDDQPLSRPMAV